MRLYLMMLAVAAIASGCRTTDDNSTVRAGIGVPKADPTALAFVSGASAQSMYDSFETPEKVDQGLAKKAFEGSIVVSCSRSGKDVFFCAMNQTGSNKILFSLDKEPALEFYSSFKISEKSLGAISTKTYEGYGIVQCQHAKVEDGRQGFYCDLSGEGLDAVASEGPVAALRGEHAAALYEALKLPEVGAGKDKGKETTASLYIRCAKYSESKFHCLMKTGSTSLAVIKGSAAGALYESLKTPELKQQGKVLKEFQGRATLECRGESCEVGFAKAVTPARRKNQ